MTTITAKHIAGLFTALALAAPTAAFASTTKHEAPGHAPAAVAMEQKTAAPKAAEKNAKDAKDSTAKTTVTKKPTVQKAGAAH
jgi:hypothetical protein